MDQTLRKCIGDCKRHGTLTEAHYALAFSDMAEKTSEVRFSKQDCGGLPIKMMFMNKRDILKHANTANKENKIGCHSTRREGLDSIETNVNTYEHPQITVQIGQRRWH